MLSSHRAQLSRLDQHAECMSCDYDPKCLYVSASFGADGQNYIMGCLGPGVPYYVLRNVNGNRGK